MENRRAYYAYIIVKNLFVTHFNPREPPPPSSNQYCQESAGNEGYFSFNLHKQSI